MKTKDILLAAAAMVLAASCIDDKGNYDYEDASTVFPPVISGLPKDTTIQQGTDLVLTAGKHFSVANDDPGRYTYTWSITEATTAGFLPTRTYIGNEENLNYPVKLAAAEWTLTLQVWDKKLDLYTKAQTTLNVVASPLDRGWYILKDQDGYTDVDYITNGGKIYADVLAPTDHRVKGTAVKMAYQSGRYYHVQKNADGTSTTLSNQKVLHILTTEDMQTFNAKDLQLFKRFNDQFYTAPAQCAPQDIDVASSMGDLFFLNAGQMYSIYGMSANIGKFGGAKVGDLDLYPCMINNASDELVWDRKSRSFLSGKSSGTTFTPFTTPAPDASLPASLSAMPYDMVKMCAGQGGNYSEDYGFALMKSTADSRHYLAHLRFDYSGQYATYPIMTWLEVPQGSTLLEGECMACPASGEFVYYSIGNKIYTYTNAQGIANRDHMQLTLPEGEKVTYMFNFRSTYGTIYNNLAVLSQTPTGYTLRIYEPQGIDIEELKPEPTAVYSGKGNARYVMYRKN